MIRETQRSAGSFRDALRTEPRSAGSRDGPRSVRLAGTSSRSRTAGLRRLLGVGRIVGRHVCVLLLSRHLPSMLRGSWIPLAEASPPDRLRSLFEELGGTFVKFGQMLALQPDILPIEYCNALFKLLDRVDPFPWSEAERILTDELGRAPDDVFDHIETEPLATASVGQVHVAWLDGVKVAVKVQRPTVEEEFGNDIRLMTGAMGLIERLRLFPFDWMLEPMREFVAWTREELDYRYEARFSETLRRRLDGRAGQHVPKVFEELTTRRILVVEFLDGVTLLDYLRGVEAGDEVLMHRLASRGFDRRRVASNVIDNFLANAFEHGIYHADLHPANLMILEDSVVGYVDFGITGVMNEYSRRHLMQMTLALVRGDMDLFHQQFLRVTTWDDDSDIEGFRSGLDELSRNWYEKGPEGPRLAANFTRVMTEMLRLSRDTNVMPERNVIKYIRSSIAIDGLVTRFEPEFDLSTYLSERCSMFLRRQRRSAFFDSEHLLAWAGAATQLLHDGPARGARALDRLTTGEFPLRPERGDDLDEQERMVRLAAVTAAGGVLVYLAPEATPGVNLLTSALVFTCMAAAALAVSLWRYSGSSAQTRPSHRWTQTELADLNGLGGGGPASSGSRADAWEALGRTWDVDHASSGPARRRS